MVVCGVLSPRRGVCAPERGLGMANRTLAMGAGAAVAGRERVVAYLLLACTVTLFGGSFVAARSLLAPADSAAQRLTPLVLAAVRFGVAGLVFVPILAGRRVWRVRSASPGARLSRGDLLRIAFLGQIGISCFFWIQYIGVQLTNAGIAAILTVGLTPLMTAVFAAWWLGERFRRSYAVAFALGFAGTAIVAAQGGAGLAFGFSRDFAIGAACLIVNAACFAVYSTLIRDLRARIDPLTMTAGVNIAGALGLILLVAPLGGWRAVGGLAAQQWLAVGYLAIGCSVIAFFGLIYALSRLEAGRVSAWTYLEPPLALLFGALLLGERIGFPSLLGGLLIGAAVWVVSRGE
jgi:drug/metabolite transporter (DMT)-like permease